MLEHQNIWRAIDHLAHEAGFSPSGLAKQAGLDPTSFNKSKRHSPDGKPRWPSTESISKILAVTGMSAADFFAIAESGPDGKTSFSSCGGMNSEEWASFRSGDRLLIRTVSGRYIAGELLCAEEGGGELRAFEPEEGIIRISVGEIGWVARILDGCGCPF